MKTTPPGQLANVVNASVTMFFHSVQPIKAAARPSAGLRGRMDGSMFESSADFDPPLDLVHLARQCLGDHELEAELLGLFRLQARALTAELIRFAAPVIGIQGKNCSPASRLGACHWGRAGRRGSGAARGIGVRRRRPALRGSGRDRRALVRSRRGPRRNRPDSDLVGKTWKAWDWPRRRWRGSPRHKDEARNALSARRRLLAAALPL